MSIIFEALRKIEAEKKEDARDGAPPAFGLPGMQPPAAGRRPSRLLVAASVVAVLLLLAFVAPRLVRRAPPQVAVRAAEPASAPAIPPMAEVTLKARSIEPAVGGFPSEAAAPAAPTAPPAVLAAEPPLPDLRLKGLSRSGSRSWAFINDRMLKVGDSIEGAEVLEILNDRVKLKRGEQSFTLVY